MGRNVSSFGDNTFSLKAGANISQNDALELGPDGRAYPVQITDYAAVSNCNYGTAQTNAATGQIVAQTQVVAGQTTAYYRQAVLQGSDGSIFTFTSNAASNQGLLLSKYSSSGGLIAQAAVDGTTSTYFAHQSFFLSNGNICVVAGGGPAGGKVWFAIYDAKLVQIKSLTALAEDVPALYFSACALSGGGFAIVYQQNSNPLLSRLATFDNTGTVVLAPTTIWTRTGTSGTQYHRIAQLSNGNLAIAVSSANTVSSIGLYHGIVTTAGVSVLAFTNLDTTSAAWLPELSVMTGYYSVSCANGTNQLGFVFDNTGTLQGAGFTAATTSGNNGTATKLVNDGTAFYLIWPRSSDSKEVLTKLPVTGTGYVTTVLNVSLSYIDAFYENEYIVLVHQAASSNSPPVMLAISTVSMSLLGSSNFGTAPGTTNGQYHRVIPGGDFSFICLYDYSSTASTNLCVGKYANTAVMGVAQAFAAPNALVPCAGIAGGYAANFIKGSPSKAFDNTATNISGNKGTLLNYGLALKGFQ